jgi:phosphohistidine swiveling domain-containing protein
MPPLPASSSPLVWRPSANGGPPDGASVGGKAHNLARLVGTGALVPPFFVLPADAFARMAGDGALPASEAEAEQRRAAILSMDAPDELVAAIRAGLDALDAGEGLLAVRSSAVGEDGRTASYAGQFETVLGVRSTEADVWAAVRRVWASAFAAHALRYLREAGERRVRMAVVVQRLVEPEVSGVAFSMDPVGGGRDTAVVSAVYGLGEGLVGGELDADTFRVRFRNGGAEVSTEAAHKDRALRSAGDGTTAFVEVDAALRDLPALTDAEARRIAEQARELEKEFGAPQDVEWALAPGPDGPRTLWTLQARPVTAAGPAIRPMAGERRVWDNENIVEPYPGITLPLSYSIGRVVMGEVFVALAETMGVPRERVEASRGAVTGLLGLVRGRVYYYLPNYLRLVTLGPGWALQAGELVRVPLPPDPPGTPAPPPGSLPAALLLAAKVLPIPPRLLRETARLDAELAEFRRRAQEVLSPYAGRDLNALTVDELRAVYTHIERDLVRHWHGPMLNDGLLDVWLLTLAQTITSWMPGTSPTLINDLIAGDGGMVSTEPMRRMAELADLARADAGLHALLAGGDGDAEVWRRLTRDAEFASFGADLRDFQQRYGDRCADEMKIEAPTFADHPELLVAALRAQVRAPSQAGAADRGARVRAAAEALVRERLPGGRQVAFFAVLEQARRQMRERENTRFERTRAMGIIRRAFLAMGARLAEAGALARAGDVVYLAKEELFGFLEGTGPGELRSIAAARREEFDAYARMPELPERFATTGPPSLSAIEPVAAPVHPGMPPASLAGMRGMGASPGVVRAPVRVVLDPRAAGDLAGKILVARQTDPGWTLLFAGAAGVLVQRGSLLSHSAIVAREMGIPCVVAIPGLLAKLSDGDVVEMDGTAGTVRIVSGGEPAGG